MQTFNVKGTGHTVVYRSGKAEEKGEGFKKKI